MARIDNGFRPQTYTAPNGNTGVAGTSYPKMNDVRSGEGESHALRNHGNRGRAHENQLMKLMGQFLQVIGQLLSMLQGMFGGQQPQAPGSPTTGTPGGTPTTGGTTGGTPTTGGTTGGTPTTGGTTGGTPTTGGTTGGAPATGGTTGGAPIGTGDFGQGWQVPWISQLNPSGSEFGYSNATANCGPASMAMIARANGWGTGLSDAQLINQLGAIGGTTAEGTSINGIAAMAQAMGKGADIQGLPELGTQGMLNWVDQSLAAGKNIVANGDFYSEPGRDPSQGPSGHYIDVVGKDENGNYKIRDPWSKEITTMTPDQLINFLKNNPVNHGYAVAVG
jgi:hypothetical protein